MDEKKLISKVQKQFPEEVLETSFNLDELTITITYSSIKYVSKYLKEQCDFKFLVDICGVDYLDYKKDNSWNNNDVSNEGFARGVNSLRHDYDNRSFGVIYHLLSLEHNYRLRIKVYLKNDPLIIDSVCSVWESANWYEREAYDLFGIFFDEHPDLRRILTDYGFIGHPFRKDFPLHGNVEVEYNDKLNKIIYKPVSIEPRTLVPKVYRCDNRYEGETNE